MGAEGQRLMPRFDKIEPVSPFDPEGDGYDYKTALDAGHEPDDAGHWSSLDPRTGLVLKGRNHPTWEKTIQTELELGNTVVRGQNNRYYSVKLPDRLSKIEPLDVDTPEEAVERVDRDYELSVETGIPLNVWESAGRNIKTGRWKYNVPFIGDAFETKETLEVSASALRLQKYPKLGGYDEVNQKLQQNYEKEREYLINKYAQMGMSEEEIPSYEFPKEPFVAEKEADEKLISEYIKYISREKDVFAKIASGVIVLPKWMVEFAVTGGLASMGDDAAKAAGEKLLKSYAKTKTGALAIKTASWGTGAVTRSFGLSSKITSGVAQQDLDEILGLKEETGYATKLLRSWGDVVIESASESFAGKGGLGEGILKSLPFGSKLSSGLEKAWIAATGGTKGEFIRKMSTKAGYSNILGEIGEERLGTVLRAITDVDDFGAGEDANMLERLKYGAIQDIENIWIEIGVLAVPQAGQVVAGRVLNVDKLNRIREQVSPELVEKEQEAKDIKDEINRTIKSTVETAEIPPDLTPVETKEAEPTPEGAEETTPQAGAEGAKLDELLEKPYNELTDAEKEKLDKATEPEVKPHTTIKDANYSDEIDDVTSQLITDRANPALTSLKQEDVKLGRELLNLDGAPSLGRKSHQASLQEAKDTGQDTMALRNASDIVAGTKESTTDAEAAGMLIKAAQLKIEHAVEQRKLEKATEPTAIAAINAKLNRIQREFDTITAGIHQAGSLAGRRLNLQKMTIDQDFSLVAVKSRAKAKKGRELNQKETAQIEKLVSDLQQAERDIKRLQEEVADLSSKQFQKQGSVARYKRMNKAERELELDSLISRTKQLLDEGC